MPTKKLSLKVLYFIIVVGKLNISNNAVKEKIATFPEDYYFSAVRNNYAGLDYELEVLGLNLF